MRFSQIHDNEGLGVNNRNTGVCFDAQANYWGNTQGPNDPSDADDGCMGPVGNSSLGEGVSDDVDYAFWAGSTTTTTVASESLNGTLVFTDAQQMPTNVQIPAGAMTRTTIIVYVPLPSPTHPISPNLRFAGHAFDLQTYTGGDAGPALGDRITVIIAYSDNDVAGIDESSLTLTYWDGDTWQDVVTACTPPSTYVRDIAANRLTVEICHLTQFALCGEAVPQRTLYLPLLLRNSR
jgi:hypothetical protein